MLLEFSPLSILILFCVVFKFQAIAEDETFEVIYMSASHFDKSIASNKASLTSLNL